MPEGKDFAFQAYVKKPAAEGKIYIGPDRIGPDRLVFCRSRQEAELRFEQVRQGLTNAVGAHVFAFGRGSGQWDTCHVIREFGDIVGL